MMGAGMPTPGGDMAFDLGAGGNDSLAQESTKIAGDKKESSDSSSINNVNFQFMTGTSGSSALDFASGFFEKTQPEEVQEIRNEYKKYAVGGAVIVSVLVCVFVLIKGVKK